MISKKPIFAISDLHLGDGGPRDNFAYGSCEKQFLAFLDYVECACGQLVIVGDFFELWQANISKVLTEHIWLLSRLARMNTIYVLGNHDADLRHFIGGGIWLSHPFFDKMYSSYYTYIGDRMFHFIHGHHVDPYCKDDTPGIGRISAIYTGLKEDRNEGPMLNKYQTVEGKVLGRFGKLSRLKNWFTGEPSLAIQMNRKLEDMPVAVDAIVCGHTHKPGCIGSWLYNCGTWAEGKCSFVKITDDGEANVYDWVNNKAILNTTELPI
ncbi:hypothetical protein LCGC14_2521650 [marine sediment metagenome]|uniref:Calcineurin-like phosphoesterase domain-containing protein n=1 Tax=marine sediment metagenome TaxID=412755 RepID=A0A0F9AWN6_9ZZZZ